MALHDPNPVDGPIGRGLWQRADRVLPGGAIYRSRSADMAGRGVLPGFIVAAEGCRVTDADGCTYVDFLGANGPNLLGYRHPEIEAAADALRARLTSASLFPPSLVEVVERILATWSDMDWGLVAKNGSEVVSLAARVARQHTERMELVAFDLAYHGSDPELAVGTPAGPLATLTGDVARLRWNDPQQLLDHLDRHGDDTAAILLNPIDQRPAVHTTDPTDDFVRAIQTARERWGLMLVLDDVRHGFRLHPLGSHHRLGLHPDLIAIGKALGNGHSISALLGTEALRPAARRIMFTSTHVFEAAPMAAAIATLDVYERDGVFDHLTEMGERLCQGLVGVARDAGHEVTISGPPTMPTMSFDDDPGWKRGRSFSRAAAGAGAIFHPFLNWNLSAAHTASDIDTALDCARVAFETTE